jgi:hypothetical protein
VKWLCEMRFARMLVLAVPLLGIMRGLTLARCQQEADAIAESGSAGKGQCGLGVDRLFLKECRSVIAL